MRTTVLLATRAPDVPSPVVEEVAALLMAAGHVVGGWMPEARLLRTYRFRPDADLYLLKSHTELALSLAGMLHSQGLPILNSSPACLHAQDKVLASQVLRRAGMMAPATWLTGDLESAIPLLEEGPVIVKPHRGNHGIGVHVIDSAARLRSLPPAPEPVIVQRVIPGSRLAFGIVSFALPLYASSLGMSLTAIGLLLSTNLVVAITLKPLVGALVDRMGVRRASIIAMALRTAGMLLLVVSPSPWQLFAVRSLHGVATALRDPAAASVLSGLAPAPGNPHRARGWWRRLTPLAGLGFLTASTAHLMAGLLPVFAVEYIGLPAAAAGGIAVTATVSLSGPLWGWLARGPR